MTKDDKSLRDTVLAELRRRRALLGEDEGRISGDDGDAQRASGAPTAIAAAERSSRQVRRPSVTP